MPVATSSEHIRSTLTRSGWEISHDTPIPRLLEDERSMRQSISSTSPEWPGKARSHLSNLQQACC